MQYEAALKQANATTQQLNDALKAARGSPACSDDEFQRTAGSVLAVTAKIMMYSGSMATYRAALDMPRADRAREALIEYLTVAEEFLPALQQVAGIREGVAR